MADNSTPLEDHNIDPGAEVDRMTAEGATETLAVDPSTALANEVGLEEGLASGRQRWEDWRQ